MAYINGYYVDENRTMPVDDNAASRRTPTQRLGDRKAIAHPGPPPAPPVVFDTDVPTAREYTLHALLREVATTEHYVHEGVKLPPPGAVWGAAPLLRDPLAIPLHLYGDAERGLSVEERSRRHMPIVFPLPPYRLTYGAIVWDVYTVPDLHHTIEWVAKEYTGPALLVATWRFDLVAKRHWGDDTHGR